MGKTNQNEDTYITDQKSGVSKTFFKEFNVFFSARIHWSNVKIKKCQILQNISI